MPATRSRPSPRQRRGGDAPPAGLKPPLLDRLRTAILRPNELEDAPPQERLPASDLEEAVRSADDKERIIGLVAAPLAAAIGLLIVGALVGSDPAALLKNGQVNKLHVNPATYESLGAVLVGLSVLMLGMAMLRKRLFLGIVTALYGLAVFNLHYWGFGVPFILAGAWLLVRAYRLQRDLREATGAGSTVRATRLQPNKRYTPPAASRAR